MPQGAHERTEATSAVGADADATDRADGDVAGAETTAGAAGELQVSLAVQGEVGADARARAVEVVRQTAGRLAEPVLVARVKLAWEPDPARPRPAVAQASLDVNGDLVRAHVAAGTMPEALDALGRRLQDRLEHRARRREARHRWSGAASPGEWRHGDLPTQRPDYFDRPVEERELVRHKTFADDGLSPDEAVFDMEQLDYDFYLFRDLATGAESFVERVGDGTYRLTRSGVGPVETGPCAAPVEVSSVPVPVLALEEAIDRLNDGGEPHVFFTDAASGRGSVVYRRYDGNYGLIVPA